MSGNSNFTTLIATTLQNFTNQLVDQVITNNSTLFFMRKAGNIKVVGGGRQFIEQILHAKNPTFAARAKLDTIDPQVTDVVSASEWDVKHINGAIAIPEADIAMNAGSREQLLDYAKTKAEEARVSMEEIMGDQMYNTAVGANDMDSIPRIISEDPSTETVNVGGISSSANSYWRNYSYDTAVTAFNTDRAGLTAIDTGIIQSTYGSSGPKLIVTTKAIWTLFSTGLTANQRYMNYDVGNAGFKALSYAEIPVVFDDNCPAGNLYGIDTDHVKLKVLAQGNFQKTPFQLQYNALIQRMIFYFMGNVTCNSRRTNFVVDSITA